MTARTNTRTTDKCREWTRHPDISRAVQHGGVAVDGVASLIATIL